MSDFNIFHPDEQNLLASSVYKIGMWMSHMDDDGACEADAKEREALVQILKRSSKQFSKTPLIAELATEAMRRENYWKSWEMNTDSVLEDVTASIKLLNGRVVDNDTKAYKELILSVASSIAGAYDENVEEDEKGLWNSLSNMVVGAANPKLRNEMNTSPAEYSALTELLELLKNS